VCEVSGRSTIKTVSAVQKPYSIGANRSAATPSAVAIESRAACRRIGDVQVR
jgi:hypothetical protein